MKFPRPFVLQAISLAVLCLPVAAYSPRLRAQSTGASATGAIPTTEDKLAFEVASVKQNKSGPTVRPSSNIPMGPGGTFVATGGFFSVTNFPLSTLSAWSYQVTGDQSLHLLQQFPGWVATDRFDVEARAGGNPTKEEMETMVRTLLADRFKLKVHHDVRQGPVYALVLAKQGRTGPQLQLHMDDGSLCTGLPPAADSGTAPPPARAGVGAQVLGVCGAGLVGMPPTGPARVRYGALGITPEMIARFMPFLLAVGVEGSERPVIDRTGLAGSYDFTIEWTPDFGKPLPPDITPGPTLTEALQEQLGLKLESTTGPVDALVIDHVEQPSPN